MKSCNRLLDDLWEMVEAGTAGEQDRVDAAALSGKSKDPRYVPYLLRLLQDEAGEVRYYALQSLVLDLQQKDRLAEDLCWRLLREDPDDDVRRMAGACLGKIFLGSRSLLAFRRLADELKSSRQPPTAKFGVYLALFQVAERPPSEWPGVLGPPRPFDPSEIDWAKVAWLEDQMTSP